MSINWVNKAKRIFNFPKPEHFTDYLHCEESADHDETLRGSAIDTIGMEELGNPGWDPICSCSDEGKKYYMPSFVRLSIETMDGDEFYFGLFLFHLEGDGKNNSLYRSCNDEQRQFISRFVEFVIKNHMSRLEYNGYENEAKTVLEIWSG